jgi:hypothetical protein
MISPHICNPFLDVKADHTEHLPSGDVPGLHADIFLNYRTAVQQARNLGQGLGVLSVGEAGSGKSHLIARLRQHIDSDPNAVLVTVRLRKGRLGHLWQPVREQLFEQLLRPLKHQGAGTNGLLRILSNRFPEWATSLQRSAGGIMDWLVGKSKNVELKPYLDELARSLSLDHEMRRVLPLLSHPEVGTLATEWLRGNQLGEEDLRKLGLAPVYLSEVERENRASDIVTSFLQLVGPTTTLILCFDEVEAIQSGNWDLAVLREFATLAVTTLSIPGPRVVISSLRFNLHTDLKKAADVTSMQKLAPTGPIFFKMLEWEQMLQIVHARIAAEPTCKLERLHHPADSDWPLSRKFLEQLYRENKRVLTPRHVLMACAQEFERLKQPTVQETYPDISNPIEQPPVKVDDKSQSEEAVSAQLRNLLQRTWQERVNQAITLPHSIHFESVFGVGLPWIVHLLELPYMRSEGKHPGIDDVNLVFFSCVKGVKSLGVGLCNDLPTTLWRRLDRLLKQWEANRNRTLGSLHLLRAEDQRTTAASFERFNKLRASRVQIHLLPTQLIAELAAYHQLLQEVQQGDLTRKSGRLISRQEYDAWAKAHLMETYSIKEFLDALFGPLPDQTTPATSIRGKAVTANA